MMPRLNIFGLVGSKKPYQICLWVVVLLSFAACDFEKSAANNPAPKTPDYYHLPTFINDSVVQAVVEIPAGSNQKIEYNDQTQQFETDSLNGKARYIDFLPYPGNYGFIPSTFSEPKQGGDGDPLDVLILAESVATGSLVKVKPIAILRLLDNGEADDKIIAIPADVHQQIIKAQNFHEFTTDYYEVRKMIGDWFRHYDPNDQVILKNWGGEDAAIQTIRQWAK